MDENRTITVDELKNYLGQSESIRLEFKRSAIFTENLEKIKDELTKTVTAFANTEGGLVIIGIIENRKGKLNIAESIDEGVALSEWPPSRVKSIIEENISPPFLGLRITTIPVNVEASRVYYVIHVPQGSTCHQAKDYKYYGRTEFDSKPLRDHEIRLRMFRGTKPTAEIVLSNFRQFSKENDNKSYISFQIFLVNIGEVTIYEFMVSLNFAPTNSIKIRSENIRKRDGEIYHQMFSNQQTSQEHICVFPQDKIYIREYILEFDDIDQLENEILIFNWRVHLSNIFPISGEINIIEEVKTWLASSASNQKE